MDNKVLYGILLFLMVYSKQNVSSSQFNDYSGYLICILVIFFLIRNRQQKQKQIEGWTAYTDDSGQVLGTIKIGVIKEREHANNPRPHPHLPLENLTNFRDPDAAVQRPAFTVRDTSGTIISDYRSAAFARGNLTYDTTSSDSRVTTATAYPGDKIVFEIEMNYDRKAAGVHGFDEYDDLRPASQSEEVDQVAGRGSPWITLNFGSPSSSMDHTVFSSAHPNRLNGNIASKFHVRWGGTDSENERWYAEYVLPELSSGAGTQQLSGSDLYVNGDHGTALFFSVSWPSVLAGVPAGSGPGHLDGKVPFDGSRYVYPSPDANIAGRKENINILIKPNHPADMTSVAASGATCVAADEGNSDNVAACSNVNNLETEQECLGLLDEDGVTQKCVYTPAQAAVVGPCGEVQPGDLTSLDNEAKLERCQTSSENKCYYDEAEGACSPCMPRPGCSQSDEQCDYDENDGRYLQCQATQREEFGDDDCRFSGADSTLDYYNIPAPGRGTCLNAIGVGGLTNSTSCIWNSPCKNEYYRDNPGENITLTCDAGVIEKNNECKSGCPAQKYCSADSTNKPCTELDGPPTVAAACVAADEDNSDNVTACSAVDNLDTGQDCLGLLNNDGSQKCVYTAQAAVGLECTGIGGPEDDEAEPEDFQTQHLSNPGTQTEGGGSTSGIQYSGCRAKESPGTVEKTYRYSMFGDDNICNNTEYHENREQCLDNTECVYVTLNRDTNKITVDDTPVDETEDQDQDQDQEQEAQRAAQEGWSWEQFFEEYDMPIKIIGGVVAVLIVGALVWNFIIRKPEKTKGVQRDYPEPVSQKNIPTPKSGTSFLDNLKTRIP